LLVISTDSSATVFFYLGTTAPSGAKASLLSSIRDHTQTHHTR